MANEESLFEVACLDPIIASALKPAMKMTPMEVPNLDGRKTVTVYDSLGIAAGSKNQQNAWKFIRFIIDGTEERNAGSFSVNRESYAGQVENDLSEDVYLKYAKEYSPNAQPLSEEEKNEIREVFGDYEHCSLYSPVQFALFEECMTPYFEDEETYETCAENLKQRLKEYLEQ